MTGLGPTAGHDLAMRSVRASVSASYLAVPWCRTRYRHVGTLVAFQGMRMRAWVVSLGLVVQLGAAPDAHALDGHRRVTQYAQTHFAARDGLPQGMAITIAQTSDGYLWVASQEGLSRFD